MDWFKRNRDWLLTLAVFSVFALVSLVWSLFFRNVPTEEHLELVKERAVFSVPADQQNNTGNKEEDGGNTRSSAFFLEPGPAEILEKLANLNHQEFSKETAKLPGLRVMWPAYFFSVGKTDKGMAEVLLDASEDGFGALILTSIDTTTYPQILKIERGTKIWIAGEIIGVDPSGTGQFLLATEYVRFDAYQPPPAAQHKEKEKDGKS